MPHTPEWVKTAKVGNKVVCVSIPTGQEQDEIFPTIGEVYTIRDVEVFEGEVFLRFMELRNPVKRYGNDYGECLFGSWRFRPVHCRLTDISVFTRLLNTVPSEMEEA